MTPLRELYFQAATNPDPMMRGMVIPMDSIAGWIVIHREPVRISDVRKDSRYFKNVAQTLSFQTKSLMGVPLITKEKVVGVLEVLNKSNGDFTETDEDMLTVLGAQAAVAIENTRLFQQSDLIAEFVHELRTPLASLQHSHLPVAAPGNLPRTGRANHHQHPPGNYPSECAGLLVPRPGAARIGARAVQQIQFPLQAAVRRVQGRAELPKPKKTTSPSNSTSPQRCPSSPATGTNSSRC